MTELVSNRHPSRNKGTCVFALALPAAVLVIACGAEPSASPEPGFGTGAAPSLSNGGDSSGASGGAASSTGGVSSGNGGIASGNGGTFPIGSGGASNGAGGSLFGNGGVQSTGSGGLFGGGASSGAGGFGAGSGGRDGTGGLDATGGRTDAGGSFGNGGASSGGAGTDGGPAASCTNGIQDGSETDVDCGGGVCPKCADGMKCSRRSDCVSNNCEGLGQRTCGNQ